MRLKVGLATDNTLHDLALLIRSRYGLIHLDTDEEERAESLLTHLADDLALTLFVWTPAKALRRAGSAEAVYGTGDAGGAFAHIERASSVPALYVFHRLGPELEEPRLVGRLTDAVKAFHTRTGAVVLTGAGLRLPDFVRPLAAVVSLPAPSDEDYRSLLRSLVRDLSRQAPVKIEMDSADLERLVANLRGLSLLEVHKILTKAMLEDGRLTADDVHHVIDAKKAIVEREGLLEYYPVQERMDEIADLAGLKAWLRKRQAFLAQRERAVSFGLSFPRGVLLLGVQGCGKSLCAKAVAQEWRLPLLKLDPSSLYSKYVGESEQNFQRAMRLAERMAPVVLWIDEIEKAFAGSGSDADGGASQRILGSFLSWLQDRRGDVFVVATANDIARLPPEFVRKGRFDEIFFVDLPDAEARLALLRIHLKRRSYEPARFDLGKAVAASDGFSGAEIEQAIVSALYAAFAAGTSLDTELLLAELSQTRPLSVTMAEKIEALREWARDRTVSAH